MSDMPPRITEASAVLNGKWIDGNPDTEISLTDFKAVFVHEFGHYLNLDHSQINQLEAFDGNPTNDNAIATMFPFLIQGSGAAISVLNLDDEVSVSRLYPDPSFATNFGSAHPGICQFLHADGSAHAYTNDMSEDILGKMIRRE